MSGERFPVGADELQAWVDDQLAPERRAEVDRWLDANPTEAMRIRAYRDHRTRLRELLAPKAAEAVPAGLTMTAVRAARRAQWRGRLRGLAASVVLLATGGGAGWLLHDVSAPGAAGRLTTEAMQAHVTFIQEVRHPVEVPAEQEAHLVTWLSNRLKRPLRVPDLTSFGLHLVGGRLLPYGNIPAAQFMFEDQAGSRLTLFVHPQASRDTGFDVVERDGVTGFRWFEDGFGYVILAPVGRDRLLAIAEAVYRETEGSAASKPGL